MDSVRIGHSKWLGLGMLVAGGGCLALGLVAMTWSSIFVGALVSAMSFAYLFGAAAVVHDTEIELKNALGMTLKRVQYPGRTSLSVVDGKVMVDRDGKAEKLVGGFGGLDAGDLDKLRTWIGRA